MSSSSPSTPAASADDIAKHGWTAVPRDANAIFGEKPFLHEPTALSADEIPFPNDNPLVVKVQEYVKRQLSAPTYNHSMRVYYFGYIILKDQFPEHFAALSLSTWALTTLLHDIGTSHEALTGTLLSFEFWGGYRALELLTSPSFAATPASAAATVPPAEPAPRAQAEAVAEAVVRHQDLGAEGTITLLGQVAQLATVYDNIGRRPGLVAPATRDAVVARFPRLGWSACFEATIREEMGLKPWAHTSHLGNAFPRGVRENGATGLMSEYEKEGR